VRLPSPLVKRLVGVGPVLLLSIALVISAAIGLNLSREPSLVFPMPVNSAALGVPRAQLGDRWSIGMESTICLDRPGKVELTSVTPVQPHGLRVIGFAVRPNQNWKPTQGVPGDFLGAARAPLRHFGFTSRAVDVACDHNSPKGYELAVRVLKTTSGSAVASGWVVTYRASERTGRLAIPIALLLCPAKSASAKRCHG
jgi:hypothetical protein